MEKGKISTKLKDLIIRHKQSLSLSTSSVLQCNEQFWKEASAMPTHRRHTK